VTDQGKWPKSWPAELEPLRKQARTFEGPKQPYLHYAIPFTKRDEFESAWPHLLKIKSKGAPIVLRRGPSFWLGDKATAGVCVHTPPAGEAPITDGKDAKGNWDKTIYIELIVDGEIIDLNRIPLPADTPIIDERFSKNSEESADRELKKFLEANPNQLQGVQGDKQPITTIPVTSKELSGIWFGATDRTGVVVRFIGRESRVKGSRGVMSGKWIVGVAGGSIGAALDFTDDTKAGVVKLTAGMWDDKTKQSVTSSLGSIERGEDDSLYLTIFENPREPMYLPAKRIPLTFIGDGVEIQRADVEKMQALMRSLQPTKPINAPE
jgi:hypothetical protein